LVILLVLAVFIALVAALAARGALLVSQPWSVTPPGDNRVLQISAHAEPRIVLEYGRQPFTFEVAWEWEAQHLLLTNGANVLSVAPERVVAFVLCELLVTWIPDFYICDTNGDYINEMCPAKEIVGTGAELDLISFPWLELILPPNRAGWVDWSEDLVLWFPYRHFEAGQERPMKIFIDPRVPHRFYRVHRDTTP
jgi:hypothetical protein